MKFRLVENFDTLNEELGVRFYLGRNGSKIGGLFTSTGKLLKQLWDEDDEHYDDINYHLSQLENLFDVPDLDYKNNNYNFAFKKSFITDEIREIIDNLNFYLNEINYEVIEETIDTPNIEYQDDNQFAYKSLEEEVLNENNSTLSYIIKNLPSNKHRVTGFWKSHPNLQKALSNINDFNVHEYDVHHINAIHSERAMDDNNTDINNLVLLKKIDHKYVTKEYKSILAEFIDTQIKSHKGESLDAETLCKLCDDPDVIHTLVSLVQSLTNMKINPNEILSIDSSTITNLLSCVPDKFTEYFNKVYFKRNPGNVLYFKTLLNEHPELMTAYKQDLKMEA